MRRLAFICQYVIDVCEALVSENVPEKALWEPLAFTLLRMTGRATLAEVEAMREATLGANMRVAAIVYEGLRRVEMIGRKQSLEKE